MKISTWINKNTVSLDGKTVAVSGATGGIGKELCEHLATLGADLVLINRSRERAESLTDELKARHNGIKISNVYADMEDIESVRAAADELLTLPIDILILNAGAYSIPRRICETGYDNVFEINFVSPYYLARTLLPSLRSRGGRVVAVGSIAHRYSKSDADDIDFSKRKQASLVYGNSKRYLMAALSSLAEKRGEVVIAHPGITFTNITAHYPKIIFALIKHPMKIIFMSARRASLSVLAGIFTDCEKNEWIGPRAFDVWGLPKKKRYKISSNETERICSAAEKIYQEIQIKK